MGIIHVTQKYFGHLQSYYLKSTTDDLDLTGSLILRRSALHLFPSFYSTLLYFTLLYSSLLYFTLLFSILTHDDFFLLNKNHT